jgi:hypothetical protein
MEPLLIFALVLALVAGVALAGYVILRRLFDRAADHVAKHMGRALDDIGKRAASTPVGQRSAAAARSAVGHLTNLGAYAATEGVTEDAARREFARSIEKLARIMDSAVNLPIIGPVGLDAVLGLLPVVGDLTSAAVSVSLIARSLRYGVPREIIARMLANVVLDVLIGTIPVAGDVADAWFRANTRNVALLREFLGDEARRFGSNIQEDR